MMFSTPWIRFSVAEVPSDGGQVVRVEGFFLPLPFVEMGRGEKPW